MKLTKIDKFYKIQSQTPPFKSYHSIPSFFVFSESVTMISIEKGSGESDPDTFIARRKPNIETIKALH